MWRPPEELVKIGFDRSRIVMMNECHNGLLRCRRTREIGRRILPIAHEAGVRNLAMEALNPPFTEKCNSTHQVLEAHEGYLSQPEMRDFIQSALNLGWKLFSYDADMKLIPVELANQVGRSMEVTNWREEVQAQNLFAILEALPSIAKLMVWCGNSHHMKEIHHDEQMMIQQDGKWILVSKPAGEPDWIPMGHQFKRISGNNPFTIHQCLFDEHSQILIQCKSQLESFGGTAGFLREEPPHQSLAYFAQFDGDAFILSTQYTME